jgi:hypothetical protein
MKLGPEEVETVRRWVRPKSREANPVPNAVIRRLLRDRLDLEKAIRKAMDNIGVPGDGYPAPIAYAYRILAKAVA